MLPHLCLYHSDFITQSLLSLDVIVVEDRMGDDMVLTAALDLSPVEIGSPPRNLSLCYQVHGDEGKFYNILSDSCVSVNVHVSQPFNDIDSHVIDRIGVHAVGSSGTIYDVLIDRQNCTVTVNGVHLRINSRFEGEHFSVFYERKLAKLPQTVHISLPGFSSTQYASYMLHITCEHFHIRNMPNPTEVLEFRVTRGVVPSEATHGLIGKNNFAMRIISFQCPECNSKLFALEFLTCTQLM